MYCVPGETNRISTDPFRLTKTLFIEKFFSMLISPEHVGQQSPGLVTRVAYWPTQSGIGQITSSQSGPDGQIRSLDLLVAKTLLYSRMIDVTSYHSMKRPQLQSFQNDRKRPNRVKMAEKAKIWIGLAKYKITCK